MRRRLLLTSAVLCLLLLLSACKTAPKPPQETSQETSQETETLETLCGEDYQTYLADTILMQMGNRMEKTPEVRYFPIEENAPLTDYAAIDETTAFHVNEKGNVVITFPAGTVTDEANGEQSFIVARP
ncbi:DUF3298 domain-containing protein [Oscillibacter sp.]|uniref:DUF3298 domain-containing protein n=1 Tax=Oscillibacter sp. TaxID=1945593 RepID=UPI00262E68B2|nr:DUF3298 domain-containing protein [Oscillibacter sp.]MDD3347686.1 hypothetical protein [Oscillibacter sp.]